MSDSEFFEPHSDENTVHKTKIEPPTLVQTTAGDAVPKLVFKTKPIDQYKNVLNLNADAYKGIYILADYDGGEKHMQMKFLLDSGASRSLFDKKCYDQIPHDMKPPIKPTGQQIRFADGSLQTAIGTIVFPLLIGDTEYNLEFLLGHFTDEGIIGLNDIHYLNLNVNFKNMLVSHGDYWLPIHDLYNSLIGRKVLVRKTVVIPAKSRMIVPGYVDKCADQFIYNEQPVLLEANDDLIDNYGVGPANSVFQCCEPEMPIMVFNAKEEPVELCSDMVMGELTEIDTLTDIVTQTGETDLSADTFVDGRNINVSQNKNATQHAGGDLPDHLLTMYDNSCEHLNEQEKLELKTLLINNSDVFSKGDFDLGRTELTKHEIRLLPGAKPVKLPPRRMAPDARAAADKIVKDLLDRGLIRKSKSQWASPIVMCKKKDGTFRLCLDYRRCNALSQQDGFPQPLITETLEALGKAVYYSIMDLACGYWQVAMDPNSIEMTAFCTHQGLYEWLVLPFGLCSAVSTFVRLMSEVLGDLNGNGCLVYVDDLIVHTPGFKSSLDKLQILFHKLRAANLKLKPKKCRLFQTSVDFLGHRVSSKGIETCPEKINEIQNWCSPKSKAGVRSFLGLTGYYRRFIDQYSKIAKPLTALTAENTKFEWDSNCEQAFNVLKQKLVQSPILSYPMDEGEWVLDTDASDVALGCVLQQRQNGELKVIAYSSKTLQSSELNYCTTKKELYAIVYFIGLHAHYFSHTRFLVRTDHSSLQYWRRFKSPNSQLMRWLDFLQSFDFDVVARPGVKNGNADSLSRKHVECVQLKKKCLCETFKNLEFEPPVVMESRYFAEVSVQTDPLGNEQMVNCNRIFVSLPVQFDEPDVVTNSCQTSVVDLPTDLECTKAISITPYLTEDEVLEAQKNDPDIGPILPLVKENVQKPCWKDISHLSAESKIILSEWQNLELRNGILYKKWHCDSGNSFWWQLVVPRKYIELVLTHAHDHVTLAHQGEPRTFENLKLRFWFPRMREVVSDWVKSCPNCQSRKPPNKQAKAPIQSFVVGAPFEKVSIDLTNAYSETDDGYNHLATFCDEFTKFVVVVPLKTMKAEEVCSAFVDRWIAYHGLPKQVHCDQGTSFENSIFKSMCELLDIEKTRCTPRYPQSNGLVERAQRSLINMLNCVIQNNPFQWDRLIGLCALAYNNTKHQSTGIAPAKLVYGRLLSLAIDLVAPVANKEKWVVESCSRDEYVLKLQAALHDINEKARQNLKNAKLKQSKYYNSNLAFHQYEKGDVVYYHYPVKNKKTSKENYLPWKGPFYVVQKISDCLYRIQRGPNKPSQVVHHNKLKKGRCRENVDLSWIDKVQSPKLKHQVEPGTSVEVSGGNRPRRARKAPERFGDWMY